MLYCQPEIAEAGSIAITPEVFDVARLATEIATLQQFGARTDQPKTLGFDPATFGAFAPRTMQTTQEVIQVAESQTGYPVRGVGITVLLCGAGVWFPAHIDELPLRRVTLQLAGTVQVDEYTPGNYPPGDLITEPGEIIKTSDLPPGAVMSIDNTCQPLDRAPHATRTPKTISTPRLAVVATLFG